MSFNVIMFYLFSAIILVFALLSITTRRILRAAVYLLFVLIATAGLYFLLQYQFMAAVQLTLYAGGIVVLIIFSILLTHHISHRFKHPDLTKLIMGVSVAVIGSGITIYTILTYPFQTSIVTEMPATMENIGTQLLGTDKNGYVLPFELISILLLAAMVAAIIIAKKEKNKNSEI
jgi:NADH-quinone oxidoreductase subunit J